MGESWGCCHPGKLVGRTAAVVSMMHLCLCLTKKKVHIWMWLCFGEGTTSRPCNRVREVLTDGLVIAGRKFEFLAFSSSQLREQAAWFFSPTPELSSADVHR
jgi:hypothetical protein